jgi:hypothetical protein
LSSITNPFNDTINYTRDTAGRLTAVTGTTFGSSLPVSTYASNIKYRAWGATKQLTAGDNKTLNATYNSRMLAATFSVTGLISKTYDYFADGKLRFSSDLLDHRFDRSYAFDHVARLKNAFSGAEARGEPATTNRPYYQTYGYDSFNHLTQRTVKIWWTSDSTVTHSYTNNRHAPQGSSWQYDADGRLLSSLNDFYTYDAAGLTTHIEVPATYSVHTSVGYDGDGRQVRTDETTWDEQTETEWTETKYYVRSSVLDGQVLTEIFDTNAGRTFVYAGQAIIAWQWLSYGWEVVDWEHKDPSGASVRRGGVSQELDPLGGDAGVSAQTQIPDEGLLLSQGSSYSAANPGMTYSMNGIRVPAEDFIAFAGFELRDILGLVEAYARQRAKPGIPHWIIPDAVPGVKQRIALEEALLSGKGIPDLLALLPQDPNSLTRRMSQAEISSLMDDILALFKTHSDCESNINAILKELAKASGFDAGSIRDIVERFRSNGIIYTADVPNQSSSAGTGIGGVPAISLSPGDNPETTARIVIGEMIHWAGMVPNVELFPPDVRGFTDHYPDAAIAAAGNRVGLNMTVEQYRHTYPHIVAQDLARWGSDFANSKVAHFGAIDNACGTPNFYRPQFAKP